MNLLLSRYAQESTEEEQLHRHWGGRAEAQKKMQITWNILVWGSLTSARPRQRTAPTSFNLHRVHHEN